MNLKPVNAARDELAFPPSPRVVEALKSMCEEVDALSRYQKEPEMLEVLAKMHNLPKNRIFLEAGVIGVMHRVFDLILTPQSTVLLPELGYPKYHHLTDYHRAKKLTFNFHNDGERFSYNIEDLLAKLSQKPNIAVLIDAESPLGFSTSESDLRRVLKSASEQTLVLLDQAHEGFRTEHTKDITSLVNDFPNLIVARGFSKFYGLAGVRIAYAVCGKQAKRMIKFQDRYLGFNVIAQRLAIAALQSEQYYKGLARQIKEQKEKLAGAINSLKGYKTYKTDTMSIIIEVPEEQLDILQTQATNAEIYMRHLAEYHKKLKNFYKVTLGPQEETDRIIDLFESVSWLHCFEVINSNAESVIRTRPQGYTIHRKEIPCEQSGLLMGLHKVIIPPSREVPPHNHSDQDELFEFHSRAHIVLDDQLLNVAPGDWIKVKKGQSHCIRALPGKFARYMALRFPYKSEQKQGEYNPSETFPPA